MVDCCDWHCLLPHVLELAETFSCEAAHDHRPAFGVNTSYVGGMAAGPGVHQWLEATRRLSGKVGQAGQLAEVAHFLPLLARLPISCSCLLCDFFLETTCHLVPFPNLPKLFPDPPARLALLLRLSGGSGVRPPPGRGRGRRADMPMPWPSPHPFYYVPSVVSRDDA